MLQKTSSKINHSKLTNHNIYFASPVNLAHDNVNLELHSKETICMKEPMACKSLYRHWFFPFNNLVIPNLLMYIINCKLVPILYSCFLYSVHLVTDDGALYDTETFMLLCE